MLEITLDPKPNAAVPTMLCMSNAKMPADVTVTYADGTTQTVHLTEYCGWFTPPAGSKGLGYTCHDQSGQCPDVSGVVG
jgi:hypothetical protein